MPTRLKSVGGGASIQRRGTFPQVIVLNSRSGVELVGGGYLVATKRASQRVWHHVSLGHHKNQSQDLGMVIMMMMMAAALWVMTRMIRRARRRATWHGG